MGGPRKKTGEESKLGRDPDSDQTAVGLGKTPYESVEAYQGYDNTLHHMPNEESLLNGAAALVRGWREKRISEFINRVRTSQDVARDLNALHADDKLRRIAEKLQAGEIANLRINTVRANTRLRVLDLCSGPGTLTGHLRRFFPLTPIDATLVDISPYAIDVARESYQDDEPTWKFITHDAVTYQHLTAEEETDFPDVIVVGSGYHHIPNKWKPQFLRNIAKHMQPNRGTILIICENLLPPYNNEDDRPETVARYYEGLIQLYRQRGASPDAILAAEQIRDMEQAGRHEFKKDFAKFKRHLKEAGLRIEEDHFVWGLDWTRRLRKGENPAPRAGSHVFRIVLNEKKGEKDTSETPKKRHRRRRRRRRRRRFVPSAEQTREYRESIQSIEGIPSDKDVWDTAGGMLGGYLRGRINELYSDQSSAITEADAGEKIPPHPKIEMLDLCSGAGEFAAHMVEHIGSVVDSIDITCVDSDPSTMEAGKQKYQSQPNWEFIEDDATQFRHTQQVDVVLASNACEQMLTEESKIAFLQTIQAHLKQTGGAGMICETLLPWHRSKNEREEAIDKYYDRLATFLKENGASKEDQDKLESLRKRDKKGVVHKVSYREFRNLLDKAGLKVLQTSHVMFADGVKMYDKAGPHIFMVTPKTDSLEPEEDTEETEVKID